MKEFNEQGFLGIGRNDTSASRPDLLDNSLEQFYKINHACMQLLHELPFYEDNGQSVFSSCLFARQLEVTQSAADLAARGARPAAMTLLRLAIEIYILAKNNEMIEGFLQEYYNIGMRDIRTLLRADSLESLPNMFSDPQHEVLREQRSQISKFFSDNKAIKLTWEKLAKRVGLESVYNIIYRLMSSHSHTRFGSLSQYFDSNHEGTRLIFQPNFDDLHRCVDSLCGFLLETAMIACNIDHFPFPDYLVTQQKDFAEKLTQIEFDTYKRSEKER